MHAPSPSYWKSLMMGSTTSALRQLPRLGRWLSFHLESTCSLQDLLETIIRSYCHASVSISIKYKLKYRKGDLFGRSLFCFENKVVDGPGWPWAHDRVENGLELLIPLTSSHKSWGYRVGIHATPTQSETVPRSNPGFCACQASTPSSQMSYTEVQ